MWGIRALAIGVVAAALGCTSRTPYNCSSSAQCVLAGEAGRCEPEGFCSFGDPQCESGQRFEPRAGGELGGACVAVEIKLPDAGTPDATICGDRGAACCSTGAACVAGTSCTAGTCQDCVADLGFGRRFGCTLRKDGTAWCSGDNSRGQLGSGTPGNVPSTTPIQVHDATSALITDASELGSGRDSACVVRPGGEVWCWGANNVGQLGDGTLVDKPAAVRVVKTDDLPLTGIVAVRAGENYTCARDGTDAVWCWGSNNVGQLGDGTVVSRSKAAPVLVAPAGAPFAGAIELLTGGLHNCVRNAANEVWCWGRNSNGQLGDGTLMPRSSPVKVYTSTSVALGRWHTCAVDPDSTISCWGWGSHGRLGIGTGESFNGGNQVTPTKVLTRLGGAQFQGASSVVAGAVSCALMQDGRVFCWGDSAYGQTGSGGSLVPAEVKLASGTPLDAERLFANHTHVCARRHNGELVCWGRNYTGELGDGTFASRGVPAPHTASCP